MKASKSVSSAFDLKVLVPDYELDGVLVLKRYYEGGFIFRELILVEAMLHAEARSGWRINYGFQNINPGKPCVDAETHPLTRNGATVGLGFSIPVEQRSRSGLRGKLRIEARDGA